MKQRRFTIAITVLFILLAVLLLLALCAGRYSMNPVDVLRVIVEKCRGVPLSDPSMENVVFLIRLPRILAAMLVGAALSLSGAVYQGVFQNPLVSPDLLGVSSGACVGAASAIMLGMSMVGTQLFAFAGGLVTVLIATTIPRLLRNSSNMMLVLSGIIVGGFMSSLLGLFKFAADPETQLQQIVFWQMGSLANVRNAQVWAVMPVILVCIAIVMLLSWRINILSFGESEAKTLGVNIKWLRGTAIACASLLTACAVSISGTIGWVGLVIPHLGRLLVGPDNTRLLPTAALLGAVFMLGIDTAARVATSLEIPLSILTGLIGAPFYGWLLYKQKAKIQ